MYWDSIVFYVRDFPSVFVHCILAFLSCLCDFRNCCVVELLRCFCAGTFGACVLLLIWLFACWGFLRPLLTEASFRACRQGLPWLRLYLPWFLSRTSLANVFFLKKKSQWIWVLSWWWRTLVVMGVSMAVDVYTFLIHILFHFAVFLCVCV